MDFKDIVKQLAERINTVKEQIRTEEATKNALIMPFIQMLGYDVFNPLEVVPEMDCDIARKKGEKIDYAILKDGEPIMLFECKHWEQELNLHKVQLKRYFVASKAKFAVLTNGIAYKFYTDIDKQNIMDETPFLEFSIDSIRDTQIEELKKFHKSYFDIDSIMDSASELKYMSLLKTAIKDEFTAPSADFVKLFTKKVYDGMATAKVLEQFTPLVKRSLTSYINDILNTRLNMAMTSDEPTSQKEEEVPTPEPEKTEDTKSQVVTTQEELEAYYIVKSILRTEIDSDRVAFRDVISYSSVFIDDNNRKLVCRFYFNNPQNLRISFIDDNEKEVRHKISNIDDIYKYSEQIKESAKRYI